MLEAQVVVQAARGVLLDHETRVFCAGGRSLAARLRRFLEVTLGAIGGEFFLWHGASSSGQRPQRRRDYSFANGDKGLRVPTPVPNTLNAWPNIPYSGASCCSQSKKLCNRTPSSIQR